MKTIKSTVYLTHFFQMNYEDSTLPCELRDGKLMLYLEFDKFEFMEGDCERGGGLTEPWNEGGEPDAIRAISTSGGYILDITALSPVASKLIMLGLLKVEKNA